MTNAQIETKMVNVNRQTMSTRINDTQIYAKKSLLKKKSQAREESFTIERKKKCYVHNTTIIYHL